MKFVFAILLLCLTVELAVVAKIAFDSKDPPPVAMDSATLRRLELRIKELDKPGARGDRYRAFECREVPRGQ